MHTCAFAVEVLQGHAAARAACDGAPTTTLGTLPPEHNGARAMGRHGGRVLLLHAPAILLFFCVKIEQ